MGRIFDDYRRVTNELLRVHGLAAAEREFGAEAMAALRAEQEKVKAYQAEVRKRDEPINLAHQTERKRFEDALKKVTDDREDRATECQRLEEKVKQLDDKHAAAAKVVKRQDGQIKRLKAELRAALAELSKEAK